MPTYDQLLLEFGGGVINAHSQSEAFKGDACVAIGIGGTGIAALKRLKKAVYQQLLPDDPKSPIPTYAHIKFIAIDSDNIDPGHGKGKLSTGEMFSIKDPNFSGVLGTEKGKQVVRNDPRMSWMDIDNISALHSPEGAGGIREAGRYLLISKADELKTRIELECKSAMAAAQTGSVTVYIFAGISGGTGSGCFIDTCYIVRQVMNQNAWSSSGKIMGFFFLPDVVTSKDEVAASRTAVMYNKRNGYAAMKELDYLMNLSLGEDRFYQKYGGFTIETQEPPVDMCHLISATKADGTLMKDGFNYCINVAADYVMSYLIDLSEVPEGADDSQGLTLRGHLANVNQGTAALPRTHGAPRIYHVVGASNAEIPMTQISTYLAAGFMRRFAGMIGREKINTSITKQVVNEWAHKLNLVPNMILGRISNGANGVQLPDVDKHILRQLGQMPRGKAPECWAIPGNDFLDKAEGKRTANCNGLKADIEDFSLDKLLTGQTASIISSIFNCLYSISTNPELGPYYAAHLIHNNGYDLGNVIEGLVETFRQQKETQELYLYGRGTGGIYDAIPQVSADYIASNLFNEKGRYNQYKDTVTDFYIVSNRIKELEAAVSVMQTVKLQLDNLYKNYYSPMITMLDNVKESFDEDLRFLSLPKAQAETAYTWQILKLADVKKSLDQAIEELQPKTLITDFLDAVTHEYQEWIKGDSDRITAFISRFMSDTFKEQMNKSLQDYLILKYPGAGTAAELADTIEREIITRVYDMASAMFWCDPNFNMQTDTYQSTKLSVPASASSVCQAADLFSLHNKGKNCAVRKTGLKDRIFAMRFFSGIPFYAYHGVDILKDEYDASKSDAAGAGVHLYAKTGRGSDGSGNKDWVNFLPTPTPYSKDPEMTENAEEKVKLYNKACELGIISPEQGNEEKWLLKVSKPIDEKTYTAEDFMTVDAEDNPMLNQVAIASVRSNIEARLEHGWEEKNLARKIIMKNDGYKKLGKEIVDKVRLDYFLSFPNQQAIAKEEIRKYDVLQGQLAQLDKIIDTDEMKKKNMEEFCGLLFYGLLECKDHSDKENYRKIARIFYPYKKAGVPTEEKLTGPGKEFKYGEQYPLYQAFLTYINLDREKMPREEMLEKYDARKKGILQREDSRIGAKLEKLWDDKAIRNLYKNVSMLGEGKDILNFYTGLVQQIQKFKDKFDLKDWVDPDDPDPQPIPTPPQPPKLTQPFYVSDGTENMMVYPEKSMSWAWSASRNNWVQLTPNMWVYQNGAWQAIKLDSQGNIII